MTETNHNMDNEHNNRTLFLHQEYGIIHNEAMQLTQQTYGLLKYYFASFISATTIIVVNYLSNFKINSFIIFILIMSMVFTCIVISSAAIILLTRIWVKSVISYLLEQDLGFDDIGLSHIYRNLDKECVNDAFEDEKVTKLYRFFICKTKREDSWLNFAIWVGLITAITVGILSFTATSIYLNLTNTGIIMGIIVGFTISIAYLKFLKLLFQKMLEKAPYKVKICTFRHQP